MRVDGLARGPGGSRGEVENLWVTFGMVKLLEEPRLMEVNMMLAGLQTGSSVIEGRLDLYSCKLAGADKEVSKSLEQSYLDELASLEALGSSPASAPGTSPVGPLTDSSNRKTLITLILTLNASFPDYDFSSLRPEDFEKEESLDHVSAKINRDMTWGAERGAGGTVTLQEEVTQKLWRAMEEVICLSECSVYSYRPEGDMDPLSAEGKIWAFNYFFYNKKLKRILYVSCMNSAEEEMEDDDDEYFGTEDMEM